MVTLFQPQPQYDCLVAHIAVVGHSLDKLSLPAQETLSNRAPNVQRHTELLNSDLVNYFAF